LGAAIEQSLQLTQASWSLGLRRNRSGLELYDRECARACALPASRLDRRMEGILA